MALPLCRVAITASALLAYLSFSARGEVGAATGPTTNAHALITGDENVSSTSAPLSFLPSCRGENVSLRVEASDEARKNLSGWLAKGKTRLIFFYFDLVVGNLTYHPGSCPNDGKTAIDAQTPLAWVVTSGGPNGSGDIESHSFAHAYLTLPVSYPRIYSLGILELGHYVARLHHEVYGMNIVVEDTTVYGASCWNELNKTEKASLMLEVVQDFVRDLDMSDNTTAWRLCYTDPTNEDLPFSNSPLIPHTPAYVCQNRNGSLQKLARDSFLKGLYVLLLILSFGALAVQFYSLSVGLQFLAVWGEKQTFSSLMDSDKLFSAGSHFFDNSQIPTRATFGGLLGSDILLGKRAFTRFKGAVFVLTFLFLFAGWPNILVQLVLMPKSCVSQSETFGRNLICEPKIPPRPSLSAVSTGVYSICGPLLCGVYSLLLLYFRDNIVELPHMFRKFSAAPVRQLSAIVATALAYLRIILLLPLSRPNNANRPNDANRCKVTTCSRCCALFWAFILAQLLFWIPLFPTFTLLVTFCLIGEVLFGLTGLRILYLNIYPESNESCASKLLSAAFALILWLFFALPAVVVLYIQGCELLMFVLLSCISLYITYPIQTFLVVSWSLALIAEAQNIINDYRTPLLAIQEAFTKKCSSLAEKHIQLAIGEGSTSQAIGQESTPTH